MKTNLTLLLAVFCLNCFAQKPNTAVKVFKISTYAPDGNLWPVHGIQMDTIKETNVKIDLQFFVKHFECEGLQLPDSLTNTRYKNEKIAIPYGQKNDGRYTIYCVYDSLSRVVSFGNTGCIVCNFLPFNYILNYNSASQIVKISPGPNSFHNFEYIIAYTPDGEVKQFDYGRDIHKQIVLIQ